MIVRLWRASSRSLLRLAPFLALAGCYQGEWRMGVEEPVRATQRLMPTRDIERWELEPTLTPYVVRLSAHMTPHCRSAEYGVTRRVDTGRFKRSGANYWKGAAIATGALGGAAALMGGAGWLARQDTGGQYALPSMYAVGGLTAAGGLLNCFLGLQKSSKVRWTLCGTLLGTGGALLLGAGLSQPTTSVPGVPTPGIPNPSPVEQPVIPTSVFQGLTYAGAGLLGVALVSGIIAATWKGEIERVKIVEKSESSTWNRKLGEKVCGPQKPLTGRTATLEVSAERAPDGPGSEADPLKLRVAVAEDGNTAVDLRPLRQALAECGVLKVQLNPDTLYEHFSEDYLPAVPPRYAQPLARPIHGQILPLAGITLKGIEGRPRRGGGRVAVPGLSDEAVLAVSKRCHAELVKGGAPPTEPARPVERPMPATEPQVALAPDTEDEAIQEEPQEKAPVERKRKKGTQPEPPRPEVAVADGECSPAVRQTIQRDCELKCSKSLQITGCVFDRRKCMIDARYSQQRQRDEELCELGFERCIFKVGVGPAAWERCASDCQKKNESTRCQSGAP